MTESKPSVTGFIARLLALAMLVLALLPGLSGEGGSPLLFGAVLGAVMLLMLRHGPFKPLMAAEGALILLLCLSVATAALPWLLAERIDLIRLGKGALCPDTATAIRQLYLPYLASVAAGFTGMSALGWVWTGQHAPRTPPDKPLKFAPVIGLLVLGLLVVGVAILPVTRVACESPISMTTMVLPALATFTTMLATLVLAVMLRRRQMIRRAARNTDDGSN